MTSLSINSASAFNAFSGNVSPRRSFAAKLALLQARQARVNGLQTVVGVTGRVVLALVPVAALSWMFVCI